MKTALYRAMLRIRMVEEEIARRYPEQQMRCPVHLSIGQEAPAAAFGLALSADDRAMSTHRSHAHYLGKGGDLEKMIAELYGKSTGCCGGRGGSMHLSDERAGFLASTAIVGNSIPVGVGVALAQQLRGESALTCVFLGDGATEEGAFYEAANFAALRHLPVLFVCENNLYSVYSPLSKRQPAERDLCTLARALGVPAEQVDGNDAQAVLAVAQRAAAEIRAGGGPRFIECMTYRWREHCGPHFDDDLGYRPTGELAAWQDRDPLPRLAAELALTDTDRQAMIAEIGAEIDRAFELALAAPYPDESTVFDAIYRTELSS
ncbi:thiamine pyrophosphate-dependent dehydrogenase E1 component subunit alpha [Paludibacterium purpuratum]|uniref:Pyruvate dehydrogenase E1 component alpha subunit n=1 Tax=Paludibacterium purpuratum TaxID=1144873 RepID=A0A4R7B677_9NEIS|nr:thiamine pyrophosphate-dependent dehydrogenase E1 component subunit alpha [Paludibacterium purpuratum]TDR78460.1 pyruvate dehydrogenase E1 component alpha subunit [Paludibacterium purpuratum]